jgi:cysteinyl-tRNA synthetase
MGLKLFNTLTRSVEDFAPRDPQQKQVAMYCCGPTVHNFAHIGNFRTFVFSDLVRRYLEFKGYQVRHVMNITDVEDKIIAATRTAGGSLREYTAKYEAAFFEDFQALGCLRPHETPHATDYILEIIELIKKLVVRGLAYQAADGSVYFSIEHYRQCGHRYGQLVNLNFEEMRVGERVSADEYDKESVADFALWKGRVPEDGSVFWPSPWGEGRPGWHIECSAMSMKLLGPSFDLHLGGEDLMFPHHEDEIAQSEGAELQRTDEPFVKYWLHVAHLLVEGKKMSKSLGNFFTLRDLLAKGFTGREIRYVLLTAHYRASFNFTLENLTGARTSLSRLDECLARLRELSGGGGAEPDSTLLSNFGAALDDDLNVSAAWGGIFEWVRETNRLLDARQVSTGQAGAALAAWQRIESVLGLGAKPETEAPAEILALLEERQAARKAKDFKRSDTLRDQLKAAGWVIEDTPKGPRLKSLH